MHNNPIEAYQSIEKTTLDGRELEASVIERATHMLRAAKQDFNTPDGEAKLIAALRFNQRVWSFFQAELVDEGNPLSVDIKRNLLALIGYIDQRTLMTMAKPRPDLLDVLISINSNIAAGLRGDTGR